MSKVAKFGIKSPRDLHDKLKYDAKLLLRTRRDDAEEQRLEEFEAFNFFVTAWHLYHDWLKEGTSSEKPKHSLEKIRVAAPKFREIKNVFRDIANGSKHFELKDPSKVEIGEREISSWYSYFYGAQFSIETPSFHFLMYELVLVITAYFDWVFDDARPLNFPPEIGDKLKKARQHRAARKKIAWPS